MTNVTQDAAASRTGRRRSGIAFTAVLKSTTRGLSGGFDPVGQTQGMNRWMSSTTSFLPRNTP